MAFRRWSNKEKKFLEENYCNITAKEIAKKLGRSKSSILNKAQELRVVKETKREYLPRPEAASKELKARVKMQEFKITKNTGDKIKAAVKYDRNTRILKGKVILKNNRFILVQTKNYRECINLVDVYTGNVSIS